MYAFRCSVSHLYGTLVRGARTHSHASHSLARLRCRVQPPYCEPELNNCGSRVASVYMMSFAVLIGQIMLNLSTTIVIEKFEEMEEVARWDLQPAHLQVGPALVRPNNVP